MSSPNNTSEALTAFSPDNRHFPSKLSTPFPSLSSAAKSSVSRGQAGAERVPSYLAGLDVPTEGTLIIDETNVSALSMSERAALKLETVGIIFQRFHLLASLSARANVALPHIELGQAKGHRRERAEALLESVGLGDHTTHKPGQLSGGEQQRVAIARALSTIQRWSSPTSPRVIRL